jgi:hypothetical protein
MKEKQIAIITADIIDSTEIHFSNREALFAKFNEGLEIVKKDFDIEFEWYRGDAFQAKILSPIKGVRITLLLKFWIKSVEKEIKNALDIRISLGLGKGEWNRDRIAVSDGEAYRISGRNLDSLKENKQTIVIDSDDLNSEALKIESVLLNSIIESITPSQSIVLFHKLRGHKESDIAKSLHLAQSTINQHSQAGNWNTISKYVDYFEKLYANA